MKKILPLLFLFLVGCGDDGVPRVEKGIPRPVEKTTTRFTVESQCKFDAGYGDNVREVLIVTDTQTGHRYLAITGCGVTELHKETTGKVTVTREE